MHRVNKKGNARAEGPRHKNRASIVYLPEELERRVLLSTAIAAFGAQSVYGAGSQPRAVAAADVNGDGNLDILSANDGNNSVGVILGNGNGTFAPQLTFGVGATPFGVTAADLNQDGKLDLISANSAAGSISVLLGNGNGTFHSQVTIATGTQARSVVAADLNGDGKLDLAVANYGAGTVSILLGNGDGTFAGQRTFSVGSQAESLVVADLNRDGKLDLAVTNKTPNSVSILLGNGNGTFGSRATFAAGPQPFSIAAGDVNGDGRIDLVTANEGDTVGVLLGNGNGTFVPQAAFFSGTSTDAVTLADLNGDGKLDIAAANYSSLNLSVLLGNGNGTFGPQTTFATGGQPFGVVASDMNHDGRLDLVVANFGSGTIGVSLGDVPPYVVSINRSNPSGQTTNATSVSFAVTFSELVTGVDATDFSLALNGLTTSSQPVVSGDDATYTVTVNGISGNGTLGLNLVDNGSIKDFEGNPIGPGPSFSFLAQQTFSDFTIPTSVQVADVNGDGKLDAVVTDGVSSTAQVMLGNGDGTFGAAREFPLSSNPAEVVIADMNGDGKPDLVASGYGSTGVICVLLGNGDGTFQPRQLFMSPTAPGSFVVTDLSGDGKLDVVVSDVQTKYFGVLLGNGDGTLAPAQTIALPMNPGQMVSADVNGDGKQDVVVGLHNAYGNGAVEVLLGNGNGTFQTGTTFTVGSAPYQIVVGDVNSDGKSDIVVRTFINGSPPASQITVMLGNGNGAFHMGQQTSVTPSGLGTLVLADLNSDGTSDLAFCNPNYISLMSGNGDGTFGAEQTFAVKQNPDFLVAADVNSDGRPDLVATDKAGGIANSMDISLGSVASGFTGQTYLISNLVAPRVTAINRFSPAGITSTANSVSYTVTFSQPVTGVDASDFKVVSGSGVKVAGPIFVSGGGANYTVTVAGIGGTGSLQLNLVDDDSIIAGAGNPLGGTGPFNGSFAGASYSILQTFPSVLSITQSNSGGSTSGGPSVSYNVTFSEPVTGVDPTDFSIAATGNTTATTPVVVTGGPTLYTVTINGIAGNGTIGLNLVDNGTIRDLLGNPLQTATTESFGPSHTIGAGTNPRYAIPVDLNGDGKTDLVVANSVSPLQFFEVSVLLGNGDGTFGAVNPLITTRTPVGVAVADVNGDGEPDIVATNFQTSGMISVFLGNGNGSFQPQLTFATGTYPVSVAIADVNNDGKLDVAVANRMDNSLSVLLGNGDGSFGAQQTYAVGVQPYDVTIADLNGDGKPDLVAANIGGGTHGISLLLGNGNGTFQSQQTLTSGNDPRYVAVSDINGDGIPDLAVANSYTSNYGDFVSVMLGNGNGTFQPQKTFGAGNRPYYVTTADLNGDGKSDLVLANLGSSTASVLFGNGDGTFLPQQTLATDNTVFSASVADLNGDGRLDLLTSGSKNLYVTVQLNTAADNVTGPVYSIIPANTIAGSAGNDQITLMRDSNGTNIDWSLGSSSGAILATDPNGLTINGNGGNDVITLDYTHGNPLPGKLHLNGNFTINGLSNNSPLSGTAVDIGQSTIFINYSAGPSPVALIQQALASGYNGGAWNGSGSGSTGAITSTAAAAGPAGVFGIGYADSADGIVNGQPANTVEIRYTLMGDANLDRTVNGADALALGRNYLIAGKTAWDQGNFNYDTTINLADAAFLRKNYNATVTGNVSPALSAPATTTSGLAPATAVAPPISTAPASTPPIATPSPILTPVLTSASEIVDSASNGNGPPAKRNTVGRKSNLYDAKVSKRHRNG